MRYRDAQHVDVGGFYARSPSAGKWFRIIGHAGVGAVAVAGWNHDQRSLVILLVALLLIWLVAWYRVVGTLWRSSLVAGIVASAVLLLAARCDEVHRAPADPSSPSQPGAHP